jgi:hypothetical protein
MQIVGNSEDARRLGTTLVQNTRGIFEDAQKANTKLQQLSSSFRDAGFAEIEETINSIFVQLNTHMDDVNDVYQILKDYAEMLEKY